MGLFAGRVERILRKCMRESYELRVAYLDGVTEYSCKVLHVTARGFVMEGFTQQPRQEMLRVRIGPMKAAFSTRLSKVSKDKQGKTVFYCASPPSIKKQTPRREHFFIYPEGEALMLPTERGQDALRMAVWDMAREGVALVNKSGEAFKRGTRFNGVTVQIRQSCFIIDLLVLYKTHRPQGQVELEILGCKFLGVPENLEALLDTCRRVDAQS